MHVYTPLFLALGLIVLTAAINVPLLLLAKRWYKEESPVPIVRRHPVFPMLGDVCVVFTSVVFLIAIFGYFARVDGVDVLMLIVFGPVMTTICSMVVFLSSRWRVTMYEDRIVHRPAMGKAKEILLSDIKLFVVTKDAVIEVFTNKKRAVLSVKDSIGFYDFQQWVENAGIEIEHQELPASIDVSLLPNR